MKLYFYALLIFFVTNVNAMKKEEQASWETLPNEVKIDVLSHVHTSSNVKEELSNLKKLVVVSTEFKDLIRDPFTLKKFKEAHSKVYANSGDTILLKEGLRKRDIVKALVGPSLLLAGILFASFR